MACVARPLLPAPRERRQDKRRCSAAASLGVCDEAGPPLAVAQSLADLAGSRSGTSRWRPSILDLFAQLEQPKLSARKGRRPSTLDSDDLLRHVFALNLPLKLLGELENFEFEDKKVIVSALGMAFEGPSAHGATYLRENPRFCHLLYDACGRPSTSMHAFGLLQTMARWPAIAASLLDTGAISHLLKLANSASFETSLDAFASLSTLLVESMDGSKTSASFAPAYIAEHFDEFFGQYHHMLEGGESDLEYVVHRRALKLLGQMLLHPAYKSAMLAYVKRDQYLQIHMSLLVHNSLAVQMQAFHVLKLFVAVPSKTRKVQLILWKNRQRLAKRLTSLRAALPQDDAFEADMNVVMQLLGAMDTP